MLRVVVVASSLWLGYILYTVRTRSYELERQDKSPEEGKYNMEEFVDMMKMLAEINTVDPAGYNATLRALDILQKPPQKIVEIGFGGGDFSILLAERYPQAQIVGVDAHNISVRVARDNHARHAKDTGRELLNLRFEHREVQDMVQEADAFDVVTTTFVNHHIFPDENFVEFLRYVRRVGKVAYIFNDLNRSPICYAKTMVGLNIIRYVGSDLLIPMLDLLYLIYPPGTKFLDFARRYLSVMQQDRPGLDLIKDGGILSMAKAFSISELANLFMEAGYPADALKCELNEESCRHTCFVDLRGLE
jgi:2-polyprenyl-3-methyl-5-hydroxy-6-metoxy-1,4-benzoquinol methylase